jgi:hypothetical protein
MCDSTSARLIEGDEEAQKTLHGKLAEVAAQHPETKSRFLTGLGARFGMTRIENDKNRENAHMLRTANYRWLIRGSGLPVRRGG